MVKNFIHSFLNILFPQKCLGCEKENEILCPQCLKRIDYPTVLESNNILAATDYNDAIAKKAIWLLKYRGLKKIAEPLAELIKQRLLTKPVFVTTKTGFVVIPIPLSPKRLRERGFNQSELIARYLTSGCLLTNILYKQHETVSQVSLKDREERLNNLENSFAVKNKELIENRNIILIDDVSTTGATINEAKKVLREAGAKSIMALVVARG